MRREQATDTTTSRLQNDVSDVLMRMDVPHAVEGITEDGIFSIDIMLSQARLAVEVDGIHHFACNTQRPLGRSFAHALLLIPNVGMVCGRVGSSCSASARLHAGQLQCFLTTCLLLLIGKLMSSVAASGVGGGSATHPR